MTAPPRRSSMPAAKAPAPRAGDGERTGGQLPDEGRSASEQIERRNQASRADADVLAAHRQAAATRALGALQQQIQRESGARPDEEVPAAASAPPTAAAAPPAPPVPAPSPDPAAPLVIDLDHKGERLVVLEGRIELRDRNDGVQVTVEDAEIVRVALQRRLTGSVLVIEGRDGPLLAARGVRADYAEQTQALIVQRARRARKKPPPSAAPPSSPVPTSSPPPPVSSAPPVDASPFSEVDLLRKLGELHRAGVLTTAEYEAKIELVARLAHDAGPRASAD
jgi:hypothetical protein